MVKLIGGPCQLKQLTDMSTSGAENAMGFHNIAVNQVKKISRTMLSYCMVSKPKEIKSKENTVMNRSIRTKRLATSLQSDDHLAKDRCVLP